MSIVYIGIGSNLGDRLKNCMDALALIEKRGISVTSISSVYETEPWGVKDQPLFLNMAIEAETNLEPSRLLAVLKNIEQKIGREKSCRWGPRAIDLDILLFDDLIVNKDDLRIPHPLMHERYFVMRPLCEIAPDAEHPLLKMSVRQLFRRLTNRRKSGHGIS